jgi:hypothetical protein
MRQTLFILIARRFAGILFSVFLVYGVITGQQHSSQDRTPSRRPTNARTSQPDDNTEQIAVTQDGRAVILRSDGTWEYVRKAPTVNLSTAVQQATLSLEAALIFQSGDIKPVARTTFYLIDAHPGEILKAAGIQGLSNPSKAESGEELVFDLSLALRTSIVPESAAFVRTAMSTLKPHIVQSVMTDFTGKAQFEPVKPGVYYLFGVVEIGRSSAYWNLRLELQPRKYALTLDNNNAAFIWSRQ